MGAPIIGRTDCPECDFKAAHVKQSEKCVFRYCPECGAQYHARTQRQRADLIRKTRTEGAAPAPAPDAKPAAPAAPAPTTKPPAPERRSVFSI